jgi:hypothetical protein
MPKYCEDCSERGWFMWPRHEAEWAAMVEYNQKKGESLKTLGAWLQKLSKWKAPRKASARERKAPRKAKAAPQAPHLVGLDA